MNKNTKGIFYSIQLFLHIILFLLLFVKKKKRFLVITLSTSIIKQNKELKSI